MSEIKDVRSGDNLPWPQLLVFFIVTSCVLGLLMSATTISLRGSYISPEEQFSFRYPEQWQIEQVDPQILGSGRVGEVYLYTGVEKTEKRGIEVLEAGGIWGEISWGRTREFMTLNVGSEIPANTNVTLWDFLGALITYPLPPDSEWSHFQAKEIRLSGRPALRLSYSEDHPPGNDVLAYLIELGENTFAILHFVIPSGETARYELTVETIAETIRLKNAESH